MKQTPALRVQRARLQALDAALKWKPRLVGLAVASVAALMTGALAQPAGGRESSACAVARRSGTVTSVCHLLKSAEPGRNNKSCSGSSSGARYHPTNNNESGTLPAALTVAAGAAGGAMMVQITPPERRQEMRERFRHMSPNERREFRRHLEQEFGDERCNASHDRPVRPHERPPLPSS